MLNQFFVVLAVFSILIIGITQFAIAETVPEWVKQITGWYSEGTVSETEFLNAIKFLIDNKIIVLETEVQKDEPPTIEEETLELLDELGLVTKPRLNKCIVLNTYYKNLGESKFKTKFSHIDYLNSCISLYKDPVWKYKGEDRVDQLYEKFIIISDQFKKIKAKITTEPTVQIASTVKIGTEKFQVDFNICAGDAIIDKAKVLIKSEIEAVQYGTTKDIPENVCRSYTTQINAKHAANIHIDILEDVEIEPTK